MRRHHHLRATARRARQRRGRTAARSASRPSPRSWPRWRDTAARPAHVLDGEQAALQDTNDHFLANLQRNGSYSVVPRIPGGEITPEKLIVIGEVARDFGLYTKITGGQRIDLFGARVEQLPLIWRRLVDAGFESGHAYGKALRTVKSCVGQTWCRYGVQDSVQMAIDLELRYRGLRSPHKLKSAVSGCARECAEAQSKDFGVIATEQRLEPVRRRQRRRRPRHADLLAKDLSDRRTDPHHRPVPDVLHPHRRPAGAHRVLAGAARGRAGPRQAVVVDDSLGLVRGAGRADGRARGELQRRVARAPSTTRRSCAASSPSSTRRARPTRRSRSSPSAARSSRCSTIGRRRGPGRRRAKS